MVQAIPNLPINGPRQLDLAVRCAISPARQASGNSDIGTGMPTVEQYLRGLDNVAPDSRILYVDHDPIVLAHARALMTSTSQGQTEFIMATSASRTPFWPTRRWRRCSTSAAGGPDAGRDPHVPPRLRGPAGDLFHPVRRPAFRQRHGHHPSTADFAPAAFGAAAAAAEHAGITLVSRGKADLERFFSDSRSVEPRRPGPGLAPR